MEYLNKKQLGLPRKEIIFQITELPYYDKEIAQYTTRETITHDAFLNNYNSVVRFSQIANMLSKWDGTFSEKMYFFSEIIRDRLGFNVHDYDDCVTKQWALARFGLSAFGDDNIVLYLDSYNCKIRLNSSESYVNSYGNRIYCVEEDNVLFIITNKHINQLMEEKSVEIKRKQRELSVLVGEMEALKNVRPSG